MRKLRRVMNEWIGRIYAQKVFQTGKLIGALTAIAPLLDIAQIVL